MAAKGGYYVEYQRNGEQQFGEVFYADQTPATTKSGNVIVRLTDKDYKPQLNHLEKQHKVLVSADLLKKTGHFD